MNLRIIGHGLSPLGKGWGPLIDEQPVMRLKNPMWQFANHSDYGKRMDYMVASCETMMAMLECAKKPAVAYFAQPKKGFWNKQTEDQFNARSPDKRVQVQIGLHNKWNEVFKSFRTDEDCPNHSLGMAAITYACEIVKPDRIDLVGFDNLLNPTLPAYYKVERGKWHSRHDWPAEHKMLDVLRAEFGIEIGEFSSATATT